MIENYKDLKVWQKSYELCLYIYRITAKSPKEERYGLTSQIRRSVVSVPSLDPLNPWTLGPSSPTKLEKNLKSE